MKRTEAPGYARDASFVVGGSGSSCNGPQPLASQTPGYGTITFRFIDCDKAELSHEFRSASLSGSTVMTRVLTGIATLCLAPQRG